jgi:hypothetical protein
MPENKIILTDWPKLKYIEANYRGLETEHLQKRIKVQKGGFASSTRELSWNRMTQLKI